MQVLAQWVCLYVLSCFCLCTTINNICMWIFFIYCRYEPMLNYAFCSLSYNSSAATWMKHIVSHVSLKAEFWGLNEKIHQTWLKAAFTHPTHVTRFTALRYDLSNLLYQQHITPIQWAYICKAMFEVLI